VALRQEEFTVLCDDVDLERDRALVERCQQGDSAAFANLYARYYERLLRFCLRRLSDRHEAEDATQEAFARAWKALPNFAGERRFYPWLTVIAGNICTDSLRRRSRSTPTEDLELGGSQPVGVATSATSDEMLLAAVDGELVHQAMDRLSVRHRHVLDMREGSGWTYQQMADHDGVEVGTIETVLWRARQALKREFNVLSESKGAFAGACIGLGAFMRRGLLRLAHRSALVVPSGGGGAVRNAFAGVVATSAAVAAVAFVTPHALPASPPTPAGTSSTVPSVSVPSSGGPSSGGPSSGGTSTAGAVVPPVTPGATSSTTGGATGSGGGLLSAGTGSTGTGSTGTSALASVAAATGSLLTGSTGGSGGTTGGSGGTTGGSGGDQAAGGTSPLSSLSGNPVLAPLTQGLLGLPADVSSVVAGVVPPAVATPATSTLGTVATTVSKAVAAITAPVTDTSTTLPSVLPTVLPKLPTLPSVGTTLKGLLGSG
jgi:RNA polymerase sigma-70 factor, ECF subfamily